MVVQILVGAHAFACDRALGVSVSMTSPGTRQMPVEYSNWKLDPCRSMVRDDPNSSFASLIRKLRRQRRLGVSINKRTALPILHNTTDDFQGTATQTPHVLVCQIILGCEHVAVPDSGPDELVRESFSGYLSRVDVAVVEDLAV